MTLPVMPLLPFRARPDHSFSTEQETALVPLERLWRAQLEDLASGIPAERVPTEVKRRRVGLTHMSARASLIFFHADELSDLDDDYILSVMINEAESLSDLFSTHSSKLSASGVSAIRGAIQSYRALLERLLAEEVSPEGPKETTFELFVRSLDDLADFGIAVAALEEAVTGHIAYNPSNLEPLARLADRAMGRVEDIFLAAGLKDRPVDRGSLIPLEEALQRVEL